MNPRRCSTFLFLVPKQRSIKVVKPSSVSPLLVKGKAYVLFSSKSVKWRPMSTSFLSRNGQLIGFCYALTKTESRDLIRRSKQTLLFQSYEKTPLRPFTRKAIRKTLKNPNVNRKISHGQKIARKLFKLNGCLTKGTCCFIATGVILLPSGLDARPSQGCRATSSIKFAGTHLYTWVERGTVRVK